MKKSLKCLRFLEFMVTTVMDGNDNVIAVEIPDCRKNHRLIDFPIAAPVLEDLSLTFDWYGHGPFELKYIVGSFTWSSLRGVAFKNLDAAEEDWVAFFVRHSPTLRGIAINNARLLSGMWAVVLKRMNEVLKLESAEFHGYLVGNDPREQWNLEPAMWSEYDDLQDQGNRTREALRKFLVSGGVCPLLDEEAHPQVR